MCPRGGRGAQSRIAEKLVNSAAELPAGCPSGGAVPLDRWKPYGKAVRFRAWARSDSWLEVKNQSVSTSGPCNGAICREILPTKWSHSSSNTPPQRFNAIQQHGSRIRGSAKVKNRGTPPKRDPVHLTNRQSNEPFWIAALQNHAEVSERWKLMFATAKLFRRIIQAQRISHF